ncbi:MAG: PEGA domain-containing protein [Deltaproteobacteria bacterium]|nr:PEGA domain-containing protein [Deltaproteobacteria bacterium]
MTTNDAVGRCPCRSRSSAPSAPSAPSARVGRLRVATAVLLLGLSLWAAAARAEARLVLAPLCDDSRYLQQLSAKLTLDLEKLGWTIADFADTQATPCLNEVAIARTLVDEGKDLFYQLRLKNARLKLQAALVELGRGTMLALEARREALLYLGWIDVESGDGAAANESFRTISRLWPDWRPSSSAVPPAVIAAFDAAAKETQAQERGTLAVRTTQGGATVFVDGVLRGQGSCEVRDLPSGDHHLRIDGQGGGSLMRWVAVPAAATVVVDPPTLSAAGSRAVLLRYAELGDKANLEMLLRGIDANAKLLLLPESGKRAPRAFFYVRGLDATNLDQDDVRGAAQAVVAMVGRPGSSGGAATRGAMRDGGAASADVQVQNGGGAWWFWPAVATAAVLVLGGAAAGIYYYDRSHDMVRVTVRP